MASGCLQSTRNVLIAAVRATFSMFYPQHSSSSLYVGLKVVKMASRWPQDDPKWSPKGFQMASTCLQTNVLLAAVSPEISIFYTQCTARAAGPRPWPLGMGLAPSLSGGSASLQIR